MNYAVAFVVISVLCSAGARAAGRPATADLAAGVRSSTVPSGLCASDMQCILIHECADYRVVQPMHSKGRWCTATARSGLRPEYCRCTCSWHSEPPTRSHPCSSSYLKMNGPHLHRYRMCAMQACLSSANTRAPIISRSAATMAPYMRKTRSMTMTPVRTVTAQQAGQDQTAVVRFQQQRYTSADVYCMQDAIWWTCTLVSCTYFAEDFVLLVQHKKCVLCAMLMPQGRLTNIRACSVSNDGCLHTVRDAWEEAASVSLHAQVTGTAAWRGDQTLWLRLWRHSR